MEGSSTARHEGVDSRRAERLVRRPVAQFAKEETNAKAVDGWFVHRGSVDDRHDFRESRLSPAVHATELLYIASVPSVVECWRSLLLRCELPDSRQRAQVRLRLQL